MEYNSQRSKMNISEYGRNIQKMIEMIMSEEDKEKRNQQAKAIIQVMGQLNPHLRDVNDFKHKLWDHLFIMSNFELDVDSPYPIPSAETLQKKPERLNYPANHISFRHYGRYIERMIEKAKDFEEGEEKNALVQMIANHLKKSYLNWNRDSVTDDEIAKHLHILSDGKLNIDNITLSNTEDILSAGSGLGTTPKKKQQMNPKGGSKPQHKKKYKKQ